MSRNLSRSHYKYFEFLSHHTLSVFFLNKLEAKRLIFSDIFLRGCCVTSTVILVYYAYCRKSLLNIMM